MFACFLAQFIKIFTGKEKFIQFSRLFTSGGMPSSHSSFVTSLATLVGIEKRDLTPQICNSNCICVNNNV